MGKSSVAAIVVAAAVCVVGIALADGSGDPTAVKQEDGKYLDKDGNPTYKIQAPTAPSTGTPIPATAAIIPNVIRATALTAKARPTRRR